MPERKKGKKIGSKPVATRKSTDTTIRETSAQVRNESATASGLRPGRSFRLRSRPSSEIAQSVEENPESILRKARKSRKVNQIAAQAPDLPTSPIEGQVERLVESIQSPLVEDYQQVDYETDNHSDQEISPLLRDPDLEQRFYRNWGYLPPLGGEAEAIINAVVANPGMAKEASRIGPEHRLFLDGLRYRNVLVQERQDSDIYADHIRGITVEESTQETNEESESHGKLWELDREKCTGTNEALFQRTLMMCLIARHYLIYKAEEDSHYLDFSVEKAWSCPPMPTRAYDKLDKFLTQPKTDLAVCFRRESVIPNSLWYNMPRATQRLACYEKMDEVGTEKVFHFCSIEAKKSYSSPDDSIGHRQSLNNASQALHNMFEFFQDAGEKHKDIFFAKVRFFSVVASTEGLTIRIHRARRDNVGEYGLIMPDRPEYPLTFENQAFLKIPKDNFDRNIVLNTFKKILVGYGANELRVFLSNAATDIMARLKGDKAGMISRQKEDFYQYGQTKIPLGSRTQTPAASQARSETNISADMLQSRTTTPLQRGLSAVKSGGGSGSKRPRDRSEDSVRPRRVGRARKG